MTPLEAFEVITTFSVDKEGKLYIEDMKKYLEACDIVEEALKQYENITSD